jgi:hypothetical protein
LQNKQVVLTGLTPGGEPKVAREESSIKMVEVSDKTVAGHAALSIWESLHTS